jgi:multidrug transporter EmrE-like cation transporter
MTVQKNAPARSYLLWFGFAGLETAAQLSLKMAAVTNDAFGGTAWVTALLRNHWFQTSIACDIVNFFMWMAILRRHDLSLAVPLSSLCYGVIILMSVLILRETVTELQLIGLVTIGAGIFVLTRDQAVD